MTNISSQNHSPRTTPWLACPLVALLALGLASATAQAQAPSFGAMTTYSSGGSANYYVATGDLNGDGVLDVVTSNYYSTSMSVLLGRATGGFDTAVAYSLVNAINPAQLALADVNQDGKLDVVVTTQSNLVVLLGTGTGTLGVARPYALGTNNGFGMKLYDVTRDGILDAVVAGTSNRVSVLPGTAAGAFGPSTLYMAGSSLRGVSLGDFNHDGRADMVVSDADQPNVYVLLGKAIGGFADPVSYPTGRTSYFVETADLNRDGQLDILVSGNQNTSVGVLNGRADGTFGAVVTYPVIPTASPNNFLTGLAVGDVNGDGYPDVVVDDANNRKVYALPGSSTGTLGAAVPFGAGDFAYEVKLADLNRDGKLDIVLANGGYGVNTVGTLLNTTVYYNSPTLTALNPTSGPVGTSVTLTGTNLTGVASVQFNGTAATTFTVVDATTLTATVPAGATTGPVTVTAPTGTATGPSFTVTYPDLVIDNTTTSVVEGIYNSITVRNGGRALLTGNVVVNSFVLVQGENSQFDANNNMLRGAATFTLGAGTQLYVRSTNGISASGATGDVQVTGTRSFSSDASYTYVANSTLGLQVTGSGLPAQVRNLFSVRSSDVALSQATSVTQVLGLYSSGNILTNGNALTLLSSAAGTALVVNSNGVVQGAVTVQRYIDPSLNPSTAANPGGKGYRHYSSPVSNTTVADLATSGFTPVLTPGYNMSATPGTTMPFPNVFGYDQVRLTTTSTNYAAFDKGWVVPTANTNLVPGRGYAVNIAGTELVDFVGTPNNGTLPVALTRNGGSTAADAGWALVGNPYPSPLDYARVAIIDRTNLDAAMYVQQSTGQYAGQYRSYVNGTSTNPAGRSVANDALIAAGQGFFVRVSQGQTSGTITFRNGQRVTTYDQQAAFQRTAADARPSVRLELAGAGLADAFVTYAEAGATPAFDHDFDAAKLPNPTGLNLSSAIATDNLAIDGRAAFTPATVLPLNVGVPAAGTYTLTATTLANLPAGLLAYLRDAQTGQLTKLAAGTSYSFSVTASEATALLAGRFTLQFSAATALAAAASLSATEVTVYPNPAHGRFTVLVPAVATASAVQAELLNTLGQVVRRQSASLPATGAILTVETAGLTTGVYTLRLQAGGSTIAKRVVLH
jgi:hypothetical protein